MNNKGQAEEIKRRMEQLYYESSGKSWAFRLGIASALNVVCDVLSECPLDAVNQESKAEPK